MSKNHWYSTQQICIYRLDDLDIEISDGRFKVEDQDSCNRYFCMSFMGDGVVETQFLSRMIRLCCDRLAEIADEENKQAETEETATPATEPLVES